MTSIELYAFTPVLITLTLLHGHWGVGKVKRQIVFFSVRANLIKFELYMVVTYMDKITLKLLYMSVACI